MTHQAKNILITGGAGFIGCNFVRHVLQNDASTKIINLDALTYAGSLDNLSNLPDPSRHFFVRGDICDRRLVDRLLREHQIDTVVHFAAESHVDRSITGPGAFVQTNVVGTYTLLEACRLYWQEEMKWNAAQCRFHHISTDEVYGTLSESDPAFTENAPYAPNSPYSASKAASDHLVRAYFHTYQLPVVTTNCSNNFGPHQHEEKFIPTIIRACKDQTPIPVYGDGRNIRDWLYVDDHCAGILAVLHGGRLGETYNIGGNNEQRNIDIVKLICRLMDRIKPDGAPHEKLISFVTDRPGHDWRYAIDASKLTKELGWNRAERFEEEMRSTINWLLTAAENAEL
ncbi:dTDP-glucose 4,6-dehydratase [Stenotrophobium rhamnosiphilum]|uniref:dTDP-glucose 4,6-dehydratase n=1 Tax=Stenotrophobium rhamnosiphilum TaxID=2029166 RepID=A0A2T5MIG2_9GAMM|nr:dTDP-glucose 4,6-dehydratase [Stenotrophobium rhamnosiphilum]PTU32355.1 dTDP-glucose 4,6-dehydratase [Stenotrophobium rhamnosiphilum]